MKIAYRIVFSEKRKTISLIVERDKQIIVHAPLNTPNDTIEKAVNSKKFWLYKKLNYTKKDTTYTLQKEYVNGESFLYLGRNYLLEFVDSKEEIKFLNRFYISKDSKQKAKKLLDQWYREKAKEKIGSIISEFSVKMGVTCKATKFTKMQYQWGSCSVDKTININYNLIKAPRFVINYVVVHELAHIIELNHSDEFWSLVKAQLPQYEQAKIWLIDNGDKLL